MPDTPAKDAGVEQVQFLLTCMKHSPNACPDFQKVSDELGLPSKGAAAKRFERVFKANGMTRPSSKAAGTDTTPKKPSPTKRTKDDVDDGEEGTPTKKVKKTPTRKAAVKKGETAEDSGKGEEDEDAKGVKAEDES